MPQVSVVNYGVGNLRSVKRGRARAQYGVRFPSVIAKQNLFATHFHPETGLAILKNFEKIAKR